MGNSLERIESHRDLRVWQAAMDMAEAACRAAMGAPANWRFALADQMIRAATSVSANIAEGYGRNSTGAYLQFLKVARGSLLERETHVLLAQRIEALSGDRSAAILQQLERVGKMLNALIKSLQQSGTRERRMGWPPAIGERPPLLPIAQCLLPVARRRGTSGRAASAPLRRCS